MLRMEAYNLASKLQLCGRCAPGKAGDCDHAARDTDAPYACGSADAGAPGSAPGKAGDCDHGARDAGMSRPGLQAPAALRTQAHPAAHRQGGDCDHAARDTDDEPPGDT